MTVEGEGFERWARAQTSAGKYYGYLGVLADAKGSGSPGYCRPYNSWHHYDRGRWYKSSGAGPDHDTYADSHVAHHVRGRNPVNLHAETDGGYTVENVASNQNQLEVCRACGNPLHQLARDADGGVIRGQGGQVEYCSARCKRNVDNARKRALRRVTRPRPQPKTSDRDGVYVAESGEGASPAPVSRPYLHHNARSLRIPVADIHSVLRDEAASGWTVAGGPDSIARRWVSWQSYRAASGIAQPAYESRIFTTRTNALPPAWDRVKQWWRCVPRPLGADGVKQVDDKVWCISH